MGGRSWTGAVAWLVFTVRSGEESRHRAMLSDLHDGLAGSADRIASRQSEEGDRLRRAVSEELERNRNQLQLFEKGLAERVDSRLSEIGGKVNERLEVGFRRTNETFLSVIHRHIPDFPPRRFIWSSIFQDKTQ